MSEKPREFCLNLCNMKVGTEKDSVICQVHVIEKSAYDELKQWCDRFEHELQDAECSIHFEHIPSEYYTKSCMIYKLLKEYQDFKSRHGGEK